jgi:hypothetical protein
MTKSSSKDDLFNRGPGVRAMKSIYSDNVDDLPSDSDDSDLEIVGPVLRRPRGRPVSKQKDSNGKKSTRDAAGEQYSRTGKTKRKRSDESESLSVFTRQGFDAGQELEVEGDGNDDIIFVDHVRVADNARRAPRVEKNIKHTAHVVEDEDDDDNDEILRRIKLTVEAALGATTAVDEKDVELEVRQETEGSYAQNTASMAPNAVCGQQHADNSRQEELSVKQHANVKGVVVLKFRFRRDSKIEKVRLRRSDRIVAKVTRPLCNVFGLRPENASFMLNGKALATDATAELLHLDDHTVIEVDDLRENSQDTSNPFKGLRTEKVVVIKIRFINEPNPKPIAVRIRRSDPIVKIRESVCNRANQDPRRVVFFLDGEVIGDKDTPDSLDVEDNTLIDAEISQAIA